MRQFSKMLLYIAFSVVLCISCKEQDLDTTINEELSSQKLTSVAELQGTWKLQSTLLGDVLELPCYESIGTKDSLSRAITLVISQNTAETSLQKIEINGQAPINLYFATAEILSYNSTKQEGTVRVSGLGSTKIAGTYELLACESRFYRLIETATDFRILVDKKGQKMLYWGAINQDKSALYAGNFMIFEKVK